MPNKISNYEKSFARNNLLISSNELFVKISYNLKRWNNGINNFSFSLSIQRDKKIKKKKKKDRRRDKDIEDPRVNICS